jgi:hypothetical protein
MYYVQAPPSSTVEGRRFLHLLFSLFFGRLRQFLESGFHMQSHFIALLVLALGAASALAQTGRVAAPGAQPASAASIEAAQGARRGNRRLRGHVGPRHAHDQDGMVAHMPARAGPASAARAEIGRGRCGSERERWK